MKLLRVGLLVSCALCAPVMPVHAADDLAISQRADEALMWQRKSRDDLAADIWRRILVLDPNHALALLNLGLIEARAGHPAEARALLLRAQRLQKPPMGLARLEAALADQPYVLPAPELAEPATEARVAHAEPRRSDSARKSRGEDSASSSSTRRRTSASNKANAARETEDAAVVTPASAAYAREAANPPAYAPPPSNDTPPRFAVPASAASSSAASDSAAFTSTPTPTSSASASTGSRSASRGADDRSPAIPFPEFASQLPMGSGTTLARPPVVPLEATSSGTVVRGKPRPTKPLPFLPPPV